MKTRFLFIVFYSLLFFACENAIEITPPVILINHVNPSVLDHITLNVEEYGSIDNVRINADYFDWFIENEDGAVVKNDFKDSSSVIWTPKLKGYYLVKVKIGYDKNKSITAIKELEVFDSIESLKNKIVGNWKGIGHRGLQNDNWGIELYIDENLHYYGYANYYEFDPYCEKGVFNGGRYDYNSGERFTDSFRNDSCGAPVFLRDLRFEIKNIEENKGSGKLYLGSITSYNLTEFDTSYFDVPFLNMVADSTTLYFEYPKYDDGMISAWFRFDKMNNEDQ